MTAPRRSVARTCSGQSVQREPICLSDRRALTVRDTDPNVSGNQVVTIEEAIMKVIAKFAIAALAGLALGASPAAAQKLTFTLNWVAGGDHAPYFYAQKMGWYKQAGLDIDFETGRGSAASAQKV